MPVANGDRLAWGLDEAVPTEARAAWGARLIVTQDGTVDFLPDRTSLAGPLQDRHDLLARMEPEFSAERLMSRIGELLGEGILNTRAAGQCTVYDSATLAVVADTKASAGYCYVAAWLKPAGEQDAFYVTARDAGRCAALAGPFPTPAAADARTDPARSFLANNRWRDTLGAFVPVGTSRARLRAGRRPPPGRFNGAIAPELA